MHIIRSNRAEALVHALATHIGDNPLPPLEAELIVVPSAPVGRWLSLELATRFGVWANPLFPFPRRAIEHLLATALDDDREQGALFEPDSLRWSIANALPMLVEHPAFSPVVSYLTSDDDSTTRRLRLSRELADHYDHYIVYRPDMLARWEQEPDADWQGLLWKHLVDRLGPHHLAARIGRLEHALRHGEYQGTLPRRIGLFSLESLPPLFLHAFGMIAAHVPTNVFVLTPTSEFWEDVRGRTSAGHPLLAAHGRLAREFQQQLTSLTDRVTAEHDCFVDPGEGSHLSSLQHDMLHLRDPAVAANAVSLADDAVQGADKSIAIHACPSRLREVQAVHDWIRGALEEDPTLDPKDVVVMAPDLTAYGPLIDAVFSNARPLIPFHVEDREATFVSEGGPDVLALLRALRGRLPIDTVFDLLALESLHARFRLDPSERTLFAELAREAGIRWGADGEHRAQTGQPHEDLHTWRAGLDRLLLGLAMPDGGPHIFGNVLACSEGADASAIVERAVTFIETLCAFRSEFQAPKILASWATSLDALLRAFFDQEHVHNTALSQLREAAETLRRDAAVAGFEEQVTSAIFCKELERRLAKIRSGGSFASNGITCRRLHPMQGTPFRVVCLLGLSDDEFPRTEGGGDLSRMQAWRTGDRSARTDDRHAFLSALMSARERLWVSFVRRERRGRPTSQMSPVVRDLLDNVNSRGGAPLVVTAHPLRPYDPRYFCATESDVFSFSQRYLAVAQRRRAPVETQPVVTPRPPLPTTISIDELSDWLWHPSRAFLRRKLGVYLDAFETRATDQAAFSTDYLTGWRLTMEALGLRDRPSDMLSFLNTTPLLPAGELGALCRSTIAGQAQTLAELARPLARGPLPPLHVSLELDGVTLEGTIANVYESARLRLDYSREGRRGDVRAWCEHLVLNVHAPAHYPRTSALVGRGAQGGPLVRQLSPVPDAASVLGTLVQLYRQTWEGPTPIFPTASRVYAKAVAAGKPQDESLELARSVFVKTGGDAEDPYVRKMHGESHPLVEHASLFQEMASSIYVPLLTSLESDESA